MRREGFGELIHTLSLHYAIMLTKPEMRNHQVGSAQIRAGLISIIVPVSNEAANIVQFLEQLRARAGDAEIIVTDGESNDGTPELARKHCDQLLHTRRGRATQMNAGAPVAAGDTFWFLHADCEVPANCLNDITKALANSETAGGFFRIRIPNNRIVYRLTDSFAHYVGLLFGIRFSDHGFFCRRASFEKIGGYPDVPLMEDADFCRNLRKLGRVVVIPSRLLVSPRRYETIGPWRLSLAYGLISTLYLLRVPLPALAAIYRRYCCRHEARLARQQRLSAAGSAE